MSTQYGLKKETLYKIIDLFSTYSDNIESALIFGSRARGDAQTTSDVDIALKLRNKSDLIVLLSSKLNELDIIYTIDLIDYNKLSNLKLKNYIDTEGKLIFLTDEKGVVQMNENKLIDKSINLKKAYKKLCESAARDPHVDDIVLDATIQRFEFTYELSWKLMKAYLEYNGRNEANSPRSAIREAFKINLLSDGDVWIKMLGDRNRTSHTYDEDTAYEIFENINKNYLKAFHEFIETIETELNKLSQTI